MKHLLKITLAIIISYAIMTFITWDWSITTWEYYQRICMVIIAVVAWLIITLVETADFTLNDESTRNDEILDTYYNYKNRKQCDGTYIRSKRDTERMVWVEIGNIQIIIIFLTRRCIGISSFHICAEPYFHSQPKKVDFLMSTKKGWLLILMRPLSQDSGRSVEETRR